MTKDVLVSISGLHMDMIKVLVGYELEVNHEPLAECKIHMKILSKGNKIAV